MKLVKGILISCVLDLPAKATLLNCHQFNGEYGCATCKYPGVQVRMLFYSSIHSYMCTYVIC